MAVDLKGRKLPKGIHQRSNGLYVGRFKYENQQYTFYDRDLEELKKTMEDKKYEVRHGLFVKVSEITLDSWFHTWITEYKKDIKENTIQTYSQVYELYIKPRLGKRKMKDIRGEMVQALINEMDANGLSYSRLNLTYVILLGMFKKAAALHLIRFNPISDGVIELPEKKRREKNKAQKEVRVMSLEEQNLFLAYAKESTYYDVYIVALSTGMRIGEILALRWRDVNFEKKMIAVNGTLVYIREKGRRVIDTPKSESSYREIPMLPQVEKLLHKRKVKQKEYRMMLGKMWKEEAGLEELVFTYDSGGALWDTGIRTEMKQIVNKINEDGIAFEKITPHTFRHTFATRGLENGIPPKVMQSILGHSSLSMTMDRYSHVLPDVKTKEMEKMKVVF